MSRQKPGTPCDLLPHRSQIDELLSQIQAFDPEWKKAPAVFRIAKIAISHKNISNERAGIDRRGDGGHTRTAFYSRNIVLPDVHHDIELIIKMLNYIREQKKLLPVAMPLFFQPDEIALALNEEQGKDRDLSINIISQLAVIFQKSSIIHIGFVFGKNYVILSK
ncbi:MAG TPA: hypothetical protein VNI77_04065 [Nitrososphaera sp.]|nr:hypothetical protein [Nitrososphaera sp.]